MRFLNQRHDDHAATGDRSEPANACADDGLFRTGLAVKLREGGRHSGEQDQEHQEPEEQDQKLVPCDAEQIKCQHSYAPVSAR